MEQSSNRLRSITALSTLVLVLAACADDGGDSAEEEGNGGTAEPADVDSTDEADGDSTDEVAEFYEGKTITIVVGLSTGGSFDVIARLLAEHMPQYIPGEPNIIVENMTGAGSMVAANHVFNVAENDGTVIGTFLGSLINQEVLENPGVEYAMDEFEWLFAGGNNTGVCIARADSGVETLEDTMPPEGAELRLAYTGPGSPGFDYGLYFEEVLGSNLDLIGGYDGNAEVRLAVERGEVDGYCVVYETAIAAHEAWEEAGDPEFNYIVHLGTSSFDEVPEATYAYDLIEDEADKQVFEVMVAQNEIFWPFAFPPDTPQDRVDALRLAAQETFDDPGFQAAVDESGLIVSPVPGDDVQAFMERIFATPAPVLERFQELLSPDQ